MSATAEIFDPLVNFRTTLIEAGASPEAAAMAVDELRAMETRVSRRTIRRLRVLVALQAVNFVMIIAGAVFALRNLIAMHDLADTIRRVLPLLHT